jgi:hypothetical protein
MKNKFSILVLTFVAAMAVAGPIKNWAAGEYITAADLNTTLNHLHSNLGHGHGSVITNADINGSAAISHSKMATPGLLPKIWAIVTCSPSACATPDISPALVISSVTYSAAGLYVVNFSARANTSYAVFVNSTSATADVTCHGYASTTTQAIVKCVTASTGAAVDSNFTFLVMDGDN